MRLLYLSADPGVPVLGHKGASIHLREMCAAFAAAGVEVHVASPRIGPEGDTLTAPVRLHGIAPVLANHHTPRTLRGAVQAQARAVTTLCLRNGIDAIYERHSLFSAAGVRAARELGLTHALEVNAPLREEAARYRTLPHREMAALYEAEVIGATNRVLAVSAPLARALIADGADPARVSVAPNAVAADRFRSPHRDPGHFVIGFAGSLKPWHGVETLLEALSRVPEAHLEVAGHGPMESLLDALPQSRVTRLGALPHDAVIARMAGWDAGVAPYAPIDGFWFSPLKVLEYMAAGTCPVVSNLGDADELLGGDRRGVLVAAGDATALADAIAALVRDRAHARELGAHARAWVREHRSWGVNARRALASLHRADVSVAA